MKKERYQLVILLIACIAIFSPNYAQYQLSPLAPQLISDFGLTSGEFAGIFSAPMIPAIFLSLVAGILVDKFGARRVLGVSLFISAAGIGLRLTANSYFALFSCMVLAGFSALFLNASGPKILGGWFPASSLGAAMGAFLAASTLGMALGMGATAMLPSVPSAYLISFGVSLLAFILWVVLMKSPPQPPEAGEQPQSPPIGQCLKVVLKNRTVWVVGLSLMFAMGGNVTLSSFLPSALGQRGFDSVAAGAISSSVMLGSLTGCLLSPVLASKLGTPRLFLFILGLIAGISTAYAWLAPQGVLLWSALFITGIAMGGLMPLLISLPIQLPEIGPLYAGTAGGLTGTLQLLGAVIIPSWIIVPLARDSMSELFLWGGICVLAAGFLAFLLPDLKKKKLLNNNN
ncbi:cyanate permease [Desulfosporosinus orientis DSM 765]|uniref:Lysosomal dipeptide transporter MFSD1 n=1 Tax=Desulfosporosinus orientis (strain ATCC 19365 / DSM 765 / NCIMB 8382 / VKM B-1628 / Singapore I) TaxID=768706 RepID=G7W6D8_DESOD|nr:MFS transporter [Desulfosporosinus orientis]AET68145.1 cyanate permease [Desulfosporosinus orientis DSM 765]